MKRRLNLATLGLAALLAYELSYGHSGGRVDTQARFVEDLLSGRSDFVIIELSAQTVRVLGDIAVVRHRFAGHTLDQGKPGQVDLHVLLVWHKRDGQWRLLARQAVRIPA